MSKPSPYQGVSVCLYLGEMMDIVYEEVDKFSDKLEIGDEISVGGLHSKIWHISTDTQGNIVLYLEIIGATKRKSKMQLILSKGLPVTTLQ
jgi:preprotein translocase subunit YajC